MKLRTTLLSLLLLGGGLSVLAQDSGTITYNNNTYPSIGDAISAAQNASDANPVITINGEISVDSPLTLNPINQQTTTFTIKGKSSSELATIKLKAGVKPIAVGTPEANINIENIIFDGQNGNWTSSIIDLSQGTNTITNVTIKNVTNQATNHRGLCELKSNAKLTVTDLTIEGCSMPQGDGYIFYGNSNLTLSGDNGTCVLYNEKTYSVKASNLTNTNPISVLINTGSSTFSNNGTIINGWSNPSYFTFTGCADDYVVASNGSNLIYSEESAVVAKIGNSNFTSLNAAINVANTSPATGISEYAINVVQDCMDNARFIPGKNLAITFQSSDPSDIKVISRTNYTTTNTMFEVNSSNSGSSTSLSFKNIKITNSYTNVNMSMAAVQAGTLFFDNVTTDFKITFPGNNNSDANGTVVCVKGTGTAYVKDSSLESVYVFANGHLILSGNNSFTLNLGAPEGSNYADISVNGILTNETPIEFIDTSNTLESYVGRALITGTTDYSKFSVPAGYTLYAKDGNLVLGKASDGYYLVGTMTSSIDGGYKPNPSYMFRAPEDEAAALDDDDTAEGTIAYTLDLGSIYSSDTFYVAWVNGDDITYYSCAATAENTEDLQEGVSVVLMEGKKKMSTGSDYLNLTFTLTVGNNGEPSSLVFTGTADTDGWIITAGNDQTVQSGTVNGDVITITSLNEKVVAHIYVPEGTEKAWYEIIPDSTEDEPVAASAEDLKAANITTDDNGASYFLVSLSRGTGTINVYTSNDGSDPVKSFSYTVLDGTPTAVEAIEAAEGEAVYYNLQGQKVMNPERGIFIKVANGKAMKVVK